jgi:hypothetical protein
MTYLTDRSARCVTRINATRFAAAILAASLVACTDAMAPNTDVGLRVWTTVSPSSVSIADTAATLRVRLYVENPSMQEISVITGGPPYKFTGNPIPNSGLFGSIRIASEADSLFAGPSSDWWGQPVYTFKPRSAGYDEMVVSVKEWRSQRQMPLATGKYRVRGWFNGREGASSTFTLQP